jgi:hypothetical protein
MKIVDSYNFIISSVEYEKISLENEKEEEIETKKEVFFVLLRL